MNNQLKIVHSVAASTPRKVAAFTSVGTSSSLEVAAREPYIVSCVNAQLPVLPAPLVPRNGPLLVTVETWSDGDVVARLPCAALQGDGETDTAALEDLATVIAEFVFSVRDLEKKKARIGGPLKKDWDSVCALVDASGLQG